MGKVKSKTKTIQSHAKRRMFERFGIVLTDEVKGKLKSMIGSGRAVLVEKQSNRVSVYLCDYEDQRFKMVYDHTRREIVTFLYETEEDYWMNDERIL